MAFFLPLEGEIKEGVFSADTKITGLCGRSTERGSLGEGGFGMPFARTGDDMKENPEARKLCRPQGLFFSFARKKSSTEVEATIEYYPFPTAPHW